MKVIKLVLLRSIEQGGTTLKDFLQSDGKPGYFAQELQVYGRKGEPCRICGTPVVGTKHAQRATFIAVSARNSSQEQECLSARSAACGCASGGPGAFVGQVSVAPSGTKTGTEPV